MKILKSLEKNINCWFLIITAFIFFLFRLPSLFEPDWYGDEGIYQVLGLGIRAGRLLYRDIFDNKPPLLYLLYSFVNSDLFLIRLLSLVFGLAAVFAFYFLAKKIIVNSKGVFIATSFFVTLFGLPIIEGNIANAENFMLFPNIIAALLILKSVETTVFKNKLLFLFTSGLILGISFLLKIVAVFDFAAFLSFLLLINFPTKLINIFKKDYLINELSRLGLYVIGFIIPICLTTLFFTLNGSLNYFLKAVLFNNVGYVGYGNTLIIPQGFLILKLTLLLLFALYLFIKRNIFERTFIFVSIWAAFSLFDTFFSQRPYTHYILVLLPSFSLLLGLFSLNTKSSKLAGIITLSIFILILLNFKFYTKTVYYYQNFISYLVGTKSTTNYEKFFDGSTPRDYQLSSFINANNKSYENVFIWGNNAQVYALSNKLPPGRYTVEYHITNYKDGISDTKNGLSKNPPKLIIIMPNVSKYPFSLAGYFHNINIKGVNIYEKFNN